MESRTVAVAVLVTGFCFSLLLHFSHLSYWQRHEAFYYDQGTPLMSTLDAYYHLRLTAQLLGEQGAGPAPADVRKQTAFSTPLLASLTALIHRASGAPIEHIAFYLPPVLGSCTMLVYLCWGCALSGPVAALTAGLAGLSSFCWYNRTCLGRFDTDCLNPFFVYLILFLVYRFVLSNGYARAAWLASGLLAAYLFNLWWLQVTGLGFALLLLAYGSSFCLPSSRAERIAKICVLTAMGAVLLGTLGGFQQLLPKPWARFVDAYAGQFALIHKGVGPPSAFPDVGESISELQPAAVNAIVEEVAGHFAPFIASLLGLLCLCRRNRGAACLLLPALLLGLLSLTARRFLIFLVPLYALGLGFFVAEIVFPSSLWKRLPKPFLQWGAAVLVGGALLLPATYLSFSRHRGPSLTPNDVFLARALGSQATDTAVVWAWWDYGYFLQYLTGKRTFIDGGSQTPERTFVAAFPLSCGNPVLARNWLRFFAARDLEGLHNLAAFFGSGSKAVSFLQKVLARPDDYARILAAHGLGKEGLEAWHRYLFPNVAVYLYLNPGLFGKTGWWYYFGSWDGERGEGFQPEFWMARVDDLEALAKNGAIRVGGQSVGIEGLIDADRDQPAGKKLVRLRGGGRIRPSADDGGEDRRQARRGRIAAAAEDPHIFYIADSRVLRALAFRLGFLFRAPGFNCTPIVHNPKVGGVWRVE